jgi:hypothetical protein
MFGIIHHRIYGLCMRESFVLWDDLKFTEPVRKSLKKVHVSRLLLLAADLHWDVVTFEVRALKKECVHLRRKKEKRNEILSVSPLCLLCSRY